MIEDFIISHFSLTQINKLVWLNTKIEIEDQDSSIIFIDTLILETKTDDKIRIVKDLEI